MDEYIHSFVVHPCGCRDGDRLAFDIWSWQMNIKEQITVFCLAALDRLMNVVTFGLWEHVRGEVTWRVMKVKE